MMNMPNETLERVIELASAIKRLRADLTEKEADLARLVHVSGLPNAPPLPLPASRSVLARVRASFSALSPNETITAQELSDMLNVRKPLVNDALSKLARSDEITRVSAGVYKRKEGGED